MTAGKDHKTNQKRSLKERQRAEREQLILESANTILLEKGYTATSMDEIAREVGISKGTLYLHFSSKEDLVLALFEEKLNAFLQLLDQVLEEEPTTQKRLERLLLETYKEIIEGRQMLIALQSIGMDRNSFRERVNHETSAGSLTQRITALFDEGKQSGEFDESIPTSIMVSMLFALMGMFDHWKQSELPSAEILTQSVCQLLFRGILAQ